MQNRRKLKRGRIHHNLRLYDNKTHTLAGYLGDISAEGIMIYCKEPYDKNCLTQMRMTLPKTFDGNKHIIFDARAVWCKQKKMTDCFNVGFKLENMSDHSKEVINSMLLQEALPSALGLERFQEDSL